MSKTRITWTAEERYQAAKLVTQLLTGGPASREELAATIGSEMRVPQRDAFRRFLDELVVRGKLRKIHAGGRLRVPLYALENTPTSVLVAAQEAVNRRVGQGSTLKKNASKENATLPVPPVVAGGRKHAVMRFVTAHRVEISLSVQLDLTDVPEFVTALEASGITVAVAATNGDEDWR